MQFIDYGNFKYEVDTKEMCNALAKIACVVLDLCEFSCHQMSM